MLAFQMAHAVEIIKLATGCTLSGYATGIPPCLTSEIGVGASLSASPNPRLLGLLNVRYVLSSHPLNEPDLILIADFGAQKIYQNRRALPRAFVIGAARTLEDEAAVLAALPQIEPGSVALLSTQLPSLLPGDGSAQEATIVSYRPGQVQVAVQRPSPGLLVLSQAWAPGWRVTDNGRVANVLRVDYALTGVYLSAGDHKVEFVYDPPEWELGWKVSLVSVLGLVLALSYSLIRACFHGRH
jgi:hypothetical protein